MSNQNIIVGAACCSSHSQHMNGCVKTQNCVLGGSFAGLSAAFDLKHMLKTRLNVTIIARQEQFVFIPSLIWVVPGWRRPEQITLNMTRERSLPIYVKRGLDSTLANQVAEQLMAKDALQHPPVPPASTT